MLQKLQHIADTYEHLQQQLYDPEIASDPMKAKTIHQEISSLEEAYTLYTSIKQYTEQQTEAEEILQHETDPEVIELAKAELEEAQSHLIQLEDKVQIVLLPKDPNDERNIYLEIRPAA